MAHVTIWNVASGIVSMPFFMFQINHMGHAWAHAFVASETVFEPAQSSARTMIWSFGAKAKRLDLFGLTFTPKPFAASLPSATMR